MAQRSVPAPFLTKTYQLVDDSSTDDVVSWSEGGSSFVVWKTADFAKDLLPNYFKHNNFSSFVRQLNTYGFRKVVPDKWEFANDNFKKGQKQLLTQIRRRKTIPSPTAAGAAATTVRSKPTSSNTGGGDLGSTSTSSQGGPAAVIAPAAVGSSKSPTTTGSVNTAQFFTNLSDENEKLRHDNEKLVYELAETRKRCEELVSFLQKYMNVGSDEISRIMRQEQGGDSSGGVRGDQEEEEIAVVDEGENCNLGDDDDNDGSSYNSDSSDDDGREEKEEKKVVEGGGKGEEGTEALPTTRAEENEEQKGLKLFGVWLNGRKRGQEEMMTEVGGGSHKFAKVVKSAGVVGCLG